jgi:CMP-N-acetylneuraminic acid synthetase
VIPDPYLYQSFLKKITVAAIIPAKGNSRRLKNKNIFPIAGKPMICWAIDACKNSKYNIDAWVSTESQEIKNIAEESGAKVHTRDKSLCGPNVFKQEVIRNTASYIASNFYKPDIVISLQANSPEITAPHLDEAIDSLIKNERSEIFSVGKDMMQNAAFRIMKYDYVFQRDLSTYCGVHVCDVMDIHTIDDVEELMRRPGFKK